MKYIICILLLVYPILFKAYGQPAGSIAHRYENYINSESARKHLSIIASDAFEGRGTGTRGAKLAADYIAAKFKAIGLQAPANNSFQNSFPLKKSTFTLDTFRIDGKPMAYGTDYTFSGVAPTGSVSADSLIFAGYGTENEIGNMNLTGKVVLILGDLNPGDTAALVSTPALIKRNPALIISIISISAPNPGNPGNTSRHMGFVEEFEHASNKQILSVLINPRVAKSLLAYSGTTYEELKVRVGLPALKLRANTYTKYTRTWDDLEATNVLGYIAGSDPVLKQEVVIVSAHYDHIGLLPPDHKGDRINNGADDNGSGVTAVLEMAKAFVSAKRNGHGPKRSILFLCTDGEEKGLFGADYYVRHPVFSLANTVANVNIDMIGRRDDLHRPSVDYCYVTGPRIQKTGLDRILKQQNDKYTHLKLDYRYDTPDDRQKVFFRSDQYIFAREHVPVIFLENGDHVDYHSPTDEVKKIDFPLLIKRTKLAFYTIWYLADMNERLNLSNKNIKGNIHF